MVDTSKWPKNVKQVGMDNLDYLGFDDENNLHWNGKKIVTEKKVSLRIWEFILAFVATSATAIQAYVSWMQYIKGE